MPELPEVETIRRDLKTSLFSREICRVRVYHDDLILGGISRRAFQMKVRGRQIGKTERRAKFLLFPLYSEANLNAPPERLMRVQLRMTGQFALQKTRPNTEDFQHPGVEFLLDDGNTLYYDDIRRLGGFDLLSLEAWCQLETQLGPEPLSSAFSVKVFAEILAPLRAPIKNTLLNQRRVAGVGNIYASEALYKAGIDPHRPAGTLDEGEIRRLRDAIRFILSAALNKSGTTIRNYRALNGHSGSFQNDLQVYGRAGGMCRRCSGTVEQTTQAGRSSFFCPNCQH